MAGESDDRPVLDIRGAGKRYGRRWALCGATVRVPAGSVVALVGANGAGKTTLLHLAVGLIRPDAGWVSVLGVAPRAAAVRGDVGFVAQDKPLYRRFRVRELLRMGAALNSRWDQRYALERLAGLGIEPRRRVGALSGGAQAQVALTLALAKRPRLLLLDEPGAMLDPLARRAFLTAIATEAETHSITVVHSSHDVAELDRACDFLVIVKDGAVVRAGGIAEVVPAGRSLEEFILSVLGPDGATAVAA